jgi:xylan 1,4-beta-xylosidase
VGGFAALDERGGLQVLVYSHHDVQEHAGQSKLEITIDHLPAGDQPLTLKQYRIDGEHSNAYTEWVRQGKPMYPTGGQYAAIKARDGLELAAAPCQVTPQAGSLRLTVELPAHAAALFVLES